MSCILIWLGCVAVQPASATENGEQANCNQVGQVWYEANVTNSNYFMGVGTIFKAGPGGSMSSSFEGTYTLSVQSNVAASIGVSNIVDASISAGASTASEYSTGQTWVYQHDITPGRFGNMRFGSYGWETNVRMYKIVPPCRTTTVASGWAKLPSNSWGYYYWET